MINQDDQDQLKGHTTAPGTYEHSKLAFVGCENCSAHCCNGTTFNRATVLLNDMFDLVKLFPIVFLRTEKNEKIEMVFFFSVKKGVPCPYQDPGSKKCTIWGSVRASICKSYPFLRKIKTTEGSETHFEIGFDRKCEGVQESAEGIKIFTDDGEISQEIYDNFLSHAPLDNYVKNLRETNKFLRLVDEFDLLVEKKIVIGKEPSPTGGFQDAVFNFLMISGQKLAALDADSVKRLQSAGYFNVINAHLKSLSNFRKLIKTAAAFEKSTQPINILDFTFGH
jgi:Fe-S-cluster containining protein